MRTHLDIGALVGGQSVAAAVSNYRPATVAPVKRFTRAEIRAYIKARGKA